MSASKFGWKVGDIAAYTYRSAKHPKGRVTAVHAASTRAASTVHIAPAPAYRFGEGTITRHMDKIRHGTLTAADRRRTEKKA